MNQDVTHQPSRPFGCVTSWGPDWHGRGGIHICNLDTVHDLPHICACGDEISPCIDNETEAR